MIVLDANILLYAYNADAPEHAASAAWLERAVAGRDPVGLPLMVVWAFLRISTNPRLWPDPLPAREAFRIVKELLALPGVVLLQAGTRHLEILEQLVTRCKAAGPLLTDAALAALALENGATLASTDRDFGRFDGLRWINPLAKTGR